MSTETHTPFQRGRRAAERGAFRSVPSDLDYGIFRYEWLRGFDSVPVVQPSVPVKVMTLPHHEGLPMPEYATCGAAGVDLMSAFKTEWFLDVGKSALIPTGLKVAIPPGYELQIRPRSGLALKHGITVLNTPGTIDEDYRGEIGVILINHGTEPFVIERGMRIAQAVLAPVTRLHWVPVDTLDDTARGDGGFGSSGL